MALTTEDMVEELWSLIGEPSDLDPYQADGTTIDTSSTGWTKMLRALNRGIVAVSTWKDPQSGRQFRFRSCYDWQDVYSYPLSTTTTAAVTAGDHTISFTSSGTIGERDEYLIKVGNEVRTITLDWGVGTYSVNKAFDNAHASGSTVYYVPKYLTITTSGNKFVEVLQVYNMDKQQQLEPAGRGDSFFTTSCTEGDPREWFRIGNLVYLDRVQFDNKQKLRVEYYHLPADMDETTDYSGLPEQFDWAVILWAVGWGFARMLDPTNKSSYRSEFVSEMRQRQGEWHVADEHNPHRGGYVKMR